jgi:NarL family two-component system sensor histidine kinase LiaS
MTERLDPKDALLKAGLTLASELSLPRSHQIVQMTREALSNVARHAEAKHSVVRLVRTGKTAVLTIEDDGVGFDVRRDSAGNGLRNMRERATAMGGSLGVSSKAGKGTKLCFTFPI